jgi:hypothetical protein
LLVFDIDHGHKFLRRIATPGLDEQGKPLNVKGVCANASSARIYVSTTRTLSCMDLRTDKLLWESPTRAAVIGCPFRRTAKPSTCRRLREITGM